MRLPVVNLGAVATAACTELISAHDAGGRSQLVGVFLGELLHALDRGAADTGVIGDELGGLARISLDHQWSLT